MQKVLENMDECVGCSSCVQSCARGCVAMHPDKEGFLTPVIDASRCTDCGLCRKACPVVRAKAETPEKKQESSEAKPAVYAAWCLDETIRMNSSSGGLFNVLAENCIKKGGTVFGASFDADYAVCHSGVSEVSGLDPLRRSKYVQSDIRGSYAKASDILKQGKPVLFSGTGCQIAGLKSYLGRDYPGLLTVDLVCYGVPSPGVWSRYLEYMKKRYGGGFKAISFRNKRNGWKKYRMRIAFDNGKVYSRRAVDETYFIGFGKGLFNRRCCSACLFRYPNSKADITLADFWGIDKLPESGSFDNKGVSQVIINTAAGREALDAIAGNCRLQERAFEEAARCNPRLVSSCPMPPLRAAFFADYAAGIPFARLKRKYMNPPVQLAKRMIKTVLGRK